MPFSPIVTRQGRLLFGLRHADDARYRGNAIMAVPLPSIDAAQVAALEPQPLVPLPAMGTEDDGYVDAGRLGHIIWSPDGTAWLFAGPRPHSPGDPYGNRGYAWVGLSDGGTPWDATEVLHGAQDIAWVPATRP